MPTIEIARDRTRWRDRGRRYRIEIDGVEVGTVTNGATVRFEVTDGSHVVQARLDWCFTRPLEVTAHPQVPVRLVVGPGTGRAAAVLTAPWTYLRLEPAVGGAR